MAKSTRLAASAILLPLFLACAAGPGGTVKLATTTSTENSGLLDVLLPPFETRYGIDVQVIAVGTGRALRHGENGDVDVVLVHAREKEEAFVRDGHGVGRRDVMHNDFAILGPMSDPASVRGLRDVPSALVRIASSSSPFVSRGDESGTHLKERELWEAARISPSGRWYMEAGQGMGAVLTMASEKRAYVLSDRGTYLAMREKLSLEVLVEGDPRLRNPYGIIAVNPARHPDRNCEGAMALIGWMTSPEGQGLIRGFRVDGQPLFLPDAVP